MQNSCDNSLTVNGAKEGITDLIQWLDGSFSLEKIATAPQALVADAIAEWRQKNWGTTKDIENLYDFTTMEELVVLCFETESTPPLAAIGTLSAMFPKLSFFLKYRESSDAFAGEADIENGDIKDKRYEQGSEDFDRITEDF